MAPTEKQSIDAGVDLLIMELIEKGLDDYEITKALLEGRLRIGKNRRMLNGDFGDENFMG